MILNLLKVILPLAIRRQLVNFRILALKYGQFSTIKTSTCTNKDKEKIPWYTYPAIEYLNNIDFSQKVIFEYGSGNSSAYWASKAKAVFSVEDNKEWYDKVKNNLTENQQIYLCESENDYLAAINKVPEKIDVIIIDGLHREKCAKLAQNHLADGGIVILDNSDWYKETSRYLRENLDLLQVDFHGFGPINAYTWTTSLFFNRNAKPHPLNNMQPHYSMAAVESCYDEKFY